METFIKIAQFFVSLSLLIFLHELGHYFFARLFKTRVNKFYLFFDFLFPMPNVLPFSLWKKKVGDTEFGLGWFPFGGYVQIDGMMDETQDADKLKSPPQPWEFRSKPAWQRLFIMLGGILANILVAFVIYAMVLYTWGETHITNDSVKSGIAVGDSVMYKAGFRDGDKIVAVNGEPVQYFDEIAKKVIIGGKHVDVIRENGEKSTVNIPEDLLGQLSTKKLDKRGLLGIKVPSIVDTAIPGKPAAGKLLKGDEIVSVNGTPISFWQQFSRYLDSHPKDQMNIVVKRAADTAVVTLTPDAEGKLGVAPIAGMKRMEQLGLIKTTTQEYGFWESFPAGVKKSFEKLADYIDQFKLLFKPSTGAYKGMGGFASMTQAFAGVWDWEAFWNITAFFSIALAFMNFLPIPMLDGGYILFTLFEMITGRKVPDRFLEKANMIGFFIIIGLMLFTNGNDVFRKIMGWF